MQLPRPIMRRVRLPFVSVIALLGLTVGMCGWCAPSAQAVPFLVGASTHFETGKTDVATFLALCAHLGTNTFRTDIPWQSIEQVKGRLALPASLMPLEHLEFHVPTLTISSPVEPLHRSD